MKDYDNAIDNYEKAIAKDPEFIGAYNNLANILYQKKNYMRAEEVCLDGLSYYPFEDSLILIKREFINMI